MGKKAKPKKHQKQKGENNPANTAPNTGNKAKSGLFMGINSGKVLNFIVTLFLAFATLYFLYQVIAN